MTGRLLVIQHEDSCAPAWFGEWWTQEGLGYDALLAHRGEPVPASLGSYDGLVVLGGEMGANDDADFSWLTPTKTLIRDAVGSGAAFLGICLGHQLAAVALGGEVVRNPHGHARGLTPVGFTAAGATDPLLAAVRPGALAVQWNGDIVSRLPESAVELATSPDGTVQAARFGERAWGVQFHPEASPDVFDSWTLGKPSAAAPGAVDVPAVAAAIRRAEPTLRTDWRPLAVRFAEIVGAALPVS